MVSDDLETQIERQRDELDRFLQAQGEELRRTLAEKGRRHYRALLEVAEETVERRLREKEKEVEKAKRRNIELEARAAQLSVEAGLASESQDAGGNGSFRCAGGGLEAQAEDAESAYVDPERMAMSGPSCKAVGLVSQRVLLPCQHLCLCAKCDQVAQACPICLTFRNSSVELTAGGLPRKLLSTWRWGQPTILPLPYPITYGNRVS
ncbi:DEAD-box ATP-dependent RNA helicase 5 [Hibiscus syriacus]|uniref:DEAD-box ATP-dependent RNA helicase 5 n=1 Tax=Hibiscus syriacus TaxID=106335 RepID=A0A6A3BZH2_HIBSY|nr:DEAD-box ATP-dependent RNA helicase 5 [Hibiscus syriacus]